LRGQPWARLGARLLINITKKEKRKEKKEKKKSKTQRVRRARVGCHPGVHSVPQPVLTN